MLPPQILGSTWEREWAREGETWEHAIDARERDTCEGGREWEGGDGRWYVRVWALYRFSHNPTLIYVSSNRWGIP